MVLIRVLIRLWCLTYSFCVSTAYLPVAICIWTDLLAVMAWHRRVFYPVVKPSILGQQSFFICQTIWIALQVFKIVLKAAPAEIPVDFVLFHLFSFWGHKQSWGFMTTFTFFVVRWNDNKWFTNLSRPSLSNAEQLLPSRFWFWTFKKGFQIVY